MVVARPIERSAYQVIQAAARSETAMPQTHVFTVCRLALEAQAKAQRLGARPTA